MRGVQVMGGIAVLVLASGVGDAAASSHPAKVSACVNGHSKIVSAIGKKCPKGSHSLSLPTTAAPVTLPAVVPSGKTLTGVWELSGPASAASQYTDAAVSFAVPFAGAPVPVLVTTATNPDPKHCTGTPAKPAAAKGYVCIYVAVSADLSGLTPYSPLTDQIGRATRFGWGVYAASTASGNMLAGGTWAATAG